MIVAALLLNGCNSDKRPVYQSQQGFRFTPPPGWVERARDDALPTRPGHRKPDPPLPRLDVPGGSAPERLLVRYDRLTAGNLAWLRLTAADLPAAVSLAEFVAAHSPGSQWTRESDAENLEVSGRPAARIVFRGRWNNQDYLSETVAVRQGEGAYVIAASFPASDSRAREQVREAVADATWPQ